MILFFMCVHLLSFCCLLKKTLCIKFAIANTRSFPPLAQQYVLRILWLPGPIKLEVIQKWVRDLPGAMPQHQEAMEKLAELHVIEQTADQTLVSLNANFRESMRKALTNQLLLLLLLCLLLLFVV